MSQEGRGSDPLQIIESAPSKMSQAPAVVVVDGPRSPKPVRSRAISLTVSPPSPTPGMQQTHIHSAHSFFTPTTTTTTATTILDGIEDECPVIASPTPLFMSAHVSVSGSLPSLSSPPSSPSPSQRTLSGVQVFSGAQPSSGVSPSPSGAIPPRKRESLAASDDTGRRYSASSLSGVARMVSPIPPSWEGRVGTPDASDVATDSVFGSSLTAGSVSSTPTSLSRVVSPLTEQNLKRHNEGFDKPREALPIPNHAASDPSEEGTPKKPAYKIGLKKRHSTSQLHTPTAPIIANNGPSVLPPIVVQPPVNPQTSAGATNTEGSTSSTPSLTPFASGSLLPPMLSEGGNGGLNVLNLANNGAVSLPGSPALRRNVNLSQLSTGASAVNMPPYASFVSRQLHKYLTGVIIDEFEEATGSSYEGAVLFADASGFTAMTQRLAKEDNGAEKLCMIINDFFTRLINIVELFGGDVVKFSGDAISIVWYVDEEEAKRTNGYISQDLTTAALRACACADQVHKSLRDYVAIDDEDVSKRVLLRLHLGVGCGRLTAVHVGGVFRRWEYILAGPPMAQIGNAEPLALPGETVVSPETWQLVKDYAKATPIKDLVERGLRTVKEAEGKLDYMRLDRMSKRVPMPSSPAPLPVTESVGTLMRRYIPNAVLPRLEDGQDGHLAELRDVSVLFVNVHGINLEPDTDGNVMNAVHIGQLLMLEIQRSVYRWEGSINKLLVDDKGLLVLCAMGLPPMPHADDPVRAVGAALHLVEYLKGLGDGVNASVGVATGRAFCGVVGSKQRREYTLMGGVVNLAARLMSHAAKESLGVVVDHATMNACVSASPMFEFDLLPRFALKGFEGTIPCYTPRFSKVEKEESAPVMQTEETDMAGREREADEVRDMVDRLIELKGGTLVLTGERGSGKTQLVEILVAEGYAKRMTVLRVPKKKASGFERAGSTALKREYDHAMQKTRSSIRKKDAVQIKHPEDSVTMPPVAEEEDDSSNVFTAWASVFQDLFTEAEKLFEEPFLQWLTSALKGDPEKNEPDMSEETYLLKNLLPSHLVDLLPMTKLNPTNFANMQEKMQYISEMLWRILMKFASLRPTMIVLHLQTGTEAQLTVDPESWELANRVSNHCKIRQSLLGEDVDPLIICVITRPLFHVTTPEVMAITTAAKENKCCMELKPLNEFERLRYSAQVLSQLSGHDVTDAAIPPELVQLLNDRAAGNPKHIMEMIKALMKNDACGDDGPAIVVLPNGRVKILTRKLYEVPVPEKMRGAIRQEFEQLSPSHQQILKLATPFKSFTPGMILDAYLADKQLDHSFSETEQFARFRRECEQLCDMGVLEARSSTLYVAQYFPRDLNDCSAYHFVSKLLQEEVHKLIPGIWKQTLETTVNNRLSKVLRSIVRLQQLFRARLMRRSFTQMCEGHVDAKEFIVRAFSRPSLSLDARMTPNTSINGDSSDLMSPSRSSPSDIMLRRRSSIMSVDEETLAQLQEEYEKGLRNTHVHVEEDEPPSPPKEDVKEQKSSRSPSPLSFENERSSEDLVSNATPRSTSSTPSRVARAFVGISPNERGELQKKVIERNSGRRLPPSPSPQESTV